MALPNETDYGMDFMGRTRFYGIYSAKVINNQDPTGRNRIQVQIPQPTGGEVTNWALACLPITDNSYHPDHNPHTASQIAALLTTSTSSASGSDPQGGTVTVSIPALTVVAKDSTKQLNHAHQTTHPMYKASTSVVSSSPYSNASSTDAKEISTYTSASGISAPGTVAGTAPSPNSPEHTFHRSVPEVGQLVWVMFVAGDPEYPVWIGVQS
jgi:hypothetical protein